MEFFLALIIILGFILLVISVEKDKFKRQYRVDSDKKTAGAFIITDKKDIRKNNENKNETSVSFQNSNNQVITDNLYNEDNINGEMEETFIFTDTKDISSQISSNILDSQINMNTRMKEFEEDLLLYDKAQILEDQFIDDNLYDEANVSGEIEEFEEDLPLVDKKNIEENELVKNKLNELDGGHKDIFTVNHDLCSDIYNSYMNNFYYHSDDIYIQLERGYPHSRCWSCRINFEKVEVSEVVDILSWDRFLSFYIDDYFRHESFYRKYEHQMYKISYDMKIIMEIKSSLVVMSETSCPDDYLLMSKVCDFDDSLQAGIKKISNTSFEDKSETLSLYDYLVNDIINSMSSSDWNQLITYKKIPSLPSDNLARAYMTMFVVFYGDFAKFYLTNSAFLGTLSQALIT